MHVDSGRQTAKGSKARGFLSRLIRDKKGSTLAMVGAGMIPLAAVIGSGVDMSRAYMAKTRLQSACDAAALAGRRVMENDTMTNTVRDEARRFFAFNFPQGKYGTTAFTPTVSRPSAGTVRVVASTRIPTAIMQLFGFSSLPLNVTCDASLNFVNTDIMLVLDVTGSMLQDINGNNTSTVANQKLTALQDAVMALYDELRPTQLQLAANNMELRYGVVPYSSAVNVGGLIRDVNPNYLVDEAEYQTRVANFNTPVYVPHPGTPEPPVVQEYPSSISQTNCDRYGKNQSFTGFSPSPVTGGGPAPKPTWSRTYSNNENTGVDWGWSGSDNSGTTRSCRRRYVEIDTTYSTEFEFTNYSYEGESVDVSAFKLGDSVQIATGSDGRTATAGPKDMVELFSEGTGLSGVTGTTWNGCIEERDTVSTITSTSGYSIPNGAFDLDIDLIPHNELTRWRPMWPRITYRRAAGEQARSSGTLITTVDEGFWACPTEARRLTNFVNPTRDQVNTYVQSLRAVGGTYHDIGMLWGARLISSGGIFGDGRDEFNGMPVSRHIIFMTDGQLAPNPDSYTSYGIEQNSQRVTGAASAPQQHDRHLQRFKMICNAIKGQNVQIWVVAFAASLSTEMTECASNPNQASTSANRDQLIARFRQIGSNIGALRLTQ